MTRKQLAALVEEWRAKLIPEWRVVLLAEPPPDQDKDYWAASFFETEYQEVKVYFTDDLLERSTHEIEVTVVHELLHPLLRPWPEQIESLEEELGTIRHEPLAAHREQEEERIIDRLSYVLAGGES